MDAVLAVLLPPPGPWLMVNSKPTRSSMSMSDLNRGNSLETIFQATSPNVLPPNSASRAELIIMASTRPESSLLVSSTSLKTLFPPNFTV